MFKWVNTGLYAVPSRITHIPGTVDEVYSRGEALTIKNGAWTKAGNGETIGGFANESKKCVTGDLALEVVEARVGDRFHAPYTGTPDAGFVVGVATADVSADGLSVLASDITGGALAVWEIIENKKTCVVTVVKRIFS